MIQKHFINGVEISDPVNWAELSIDLNYNDDSVTDAVSINSWEIGVGDKRNAADGLEILKSYIQKGLSGGTGVTEGILYQIYLDNQKGTNYNIFNGYLDLWRAKIESNKITAPATEQGRLDWLNTVADSVTFEYLFEVTKELTADDFIAIPYVHNRKANGIEVAVTLLSLFFIIQSIKSLIQDIIYTISQLAGLDFSAIIRIILQFIQIVTYAIAVASLSVQVFQALIPPIKYHYGMYVSDLLRIGLAHFGLKFSSSVFETGVYKDMFILPEKYNLRINTGRFSGVDGIIQLNNSDKKGFYNGTLGQLIRDMKSTLYLKSLISNDTLFLEKQDFKLPKPAYQLPNLDRYEFDGYSFNSEDFNSNVILSFQTDLNDRNTIQEYIGTSVQVITTPKAVGDQKRVLTRNLKEVTFPFALGKGKTELSFIERLIDGFNRDISAVVGAIEKVLNTVEKTINGAVSTINKIIKALKVVGIKLNFSLGTAKLPSGVSKALNNLQLKLESGRIGMLMMENDFVYIPKLMIVDRRATARQRTLGTNNGLLTAKYIYDNYHYFDSFVPDSNNIHGQYLIKSFSKIPFTFEDFEKVRSSNFIFDIDGNEARLISLKYNPIEGTATGEYKVKQIYTSNLKQDKIEPNGQ